MEAFDDMILYVLIAAGVFLVIMCLLSLLRCRSRKQSVIPQNASTNIYTVPTNYNSVTPNGATFLHDPAPSDTRNFGHNRISSHGDRFAVPIDLLPTNFDYTAPGVEYKEDYVLVKDLSVIQVPARDEYQKQAPYNPHFH